MSDAKLEQSSDEGDNQEPLRRRPTELVALIDESTPQAGGGVYYVMTTAVVIQIEQVSTGLSELFDDVPGRRRPFHWHKEGPEMRERMIQLITDNGVVAHCRWQSVGRTQQVTARRELLLALADDIEGDGADQLIIEAGDLHTNRRDRQALLDHYRDRGGVPFTYEWRGKNEPLLWIPDAIGGAASGFLLDSDPGWYKRLHDAGVVEESPLSM